LIELEANEGKGGRREGEEEEEEMSEDLEL
jgi:hypothetical protein